MDYIQIATILIAVYGAFLSTILAIYKISSDRKRLKVNLDLAVISDSINKPQNVLSLSCANIGKRPITIQSYGIEMPNKNNFFFINECPDKLPKTLSDGEGCTLCGNLQGITKVLIETGYNGTVEVFGFFKDTSGNKYKGNKFKFNMTEFLDETES